VQVGGITATLLNSQFNPDVWRKKIEPAQKLYVWAMNNHWGTNYRAYQEGPVQFRFVLRPHRGRASDAENSRFATAFSQPLVATPARGRAPSPTPLLRVEPADVLVTALKPSDDGRAWILRLFGASGTPANAKLTWSKPAPRMTWLSDTSEKPVEKLTGDIPVPAWGVVTVRAEWMQ
jgi:alpha-mannosidase